MMHASARWFSNESSRQSLSLSVGQTPPLDPTAHMRVHPRELKFL